MSRRLYPYDDFDPLFGRPIRRARSRPVRPEPFAPELELAPEPVPEPAPEPEPTADKDSLRSALRELEKAKARVERDAARIADETRAKLIEQLFPVLDNLDRSIAAARDSSDQSLLDGVKLVREQFAKVLASYGVERIDSVGCAFDPNEHDAIAVAAVDDRRKDGVVLDEWEPGYRLGERVLRPAKVRVGKLAA